MPRNNSHFQSSRRFAGIQIQKGSTFTCTVCGKRTRETGHDESSLEQCAFCYIEGGLENSLSDGFITQEEFDATMTDLRKQYKRDEVSAPSSIGE